MKLYFYRRSDDKPNFGDELNLWLWDKVMPGVLDDNEAVAFFGIGTLLNNLVKERVPNAKKIVALGTGAGYNKGMPNVDDSWKVYSLRGPLSALKLGLDPKLAITDGAALIRRVYKPTTKKKYKYAYIPHFTQSIIAGDDWQDICEELGIHYIDARWPIEQILQEICETEVLLAEAMHGAIISDALRTPWIPVQTSQWILPSKWIDWTLSLNLEFQPFPVTGLNELRPEWRLGNVRGPRGSRTALKKSYEHGLRKAAAKTQFVKILAEGKPQLSSDELIESHTCRLEEKVEEFKRDIAAGMFETGASVTSQADERQPIHIISR